jgi:hypothetical protein
MRRPSRLAKSPAATAARPAAFVPAAFVLPVALLLLLVLLPGCGALQRAHLRHRVHEHEVRTLAYWGGAWAARPLAERVAPLPDAAVDYVSLDNELWGFAARPSAVEPPPSFARALAGVEATLSPALARVLRERLIGVFAATGLGSSGYAETVRDGSGREQAMFIVLDPEAAGARTANAWASWKESTFFRQSADAPVRVRLEIEEPGADTAENAVRYILLHEIGHVLGLFTGAHPGWNAEESAVPRPAGGWAFPPLSWVRGADGAWTSRWAGLFPERGELRYYADHPTLPAASVPALYARLERTNLPSLYALTSVWEDFAESFASYAHVVRAGRPWRLTVTVGAGANETRPAPATALGACWNEPRCADKRAFMDAWFRDPALSAGRAASNARP